MFRFAFALDVQKKYKYYCFRAFHIQICIHHGRSNLHSPWVSLWWSISCSELHSPWPFIRNVKIILLVHLFFRFEFALDVQKKCKYFFFVHFLFRFAFAFDVQKKSKYYCFGPFHFQICICLDIIVLVYFMFRLEFALDVQKKCKYYCFGPFHVQICIRLGRSEEVQILLFWSISSSDLDSPWTFRINVNIIVLVHFIMRFTFRFTFVIDIRMKCKYYCFGPFHVQSCIRLGRYRRNVNIIAFGSIHAQIRIRLGRSEQM